MLSVGYCLAEVSIQCSSRYTVLTFFLVGNQSYYEIPNIYTIIKHLCGPVKCIKIKLLKQECHANSTVTGVYCKYPGFPDDL